GRKAAAQPLDRAYARRAARAGAGADLLLRGIEGGGRSRRRLQGKAQARVLRGVARRLALGERSLAGRTRHAALRDRRRARMSAASATPKAPPSAEQPHRTRSSDRSTPPSGVEPRPPSARMAPPSVVPPSPADTPPSATGSPPSGAAPHLFATQKKLA